ncbi:MAG: EamA family transporter [Treponema sp.]|nr:EamA family transporter [Treponema sp.]
MAFPFNNGRLNGCPGLSGQGAVFLCALLWSTSGLFIRLVDWHPMLIVGSRSFLAALFLLALRRLSPGPKKRIALGEMPALALYGICYAATMILFVTANTMTAAANAIMLQYAAPVWAALLGWFFLRERPLWEQWCALALVGLGMFFVFSGGLEAGSMTGDMLALASGVSFAGNTVVLRAYALRTGKDGSPMDILIFSHIICAVFSVPFFFLHPVTLTAHNILCIAYMGIFQIGLASALFATGIKRVPVTQAMLISSIEPVVNPIWVMLALGERPTVFAVVGGGIIVAAVLFSSILPALRRRS